MLMIGQLVKYVNGQVIVNIPNTLQCLVNNQVDGKTLLSLTSRDLREEIGVSAINERKRLHSDINVLKGYASLSISDANYLSVKLFSDESKYEKEVEADYSDMTIAEREQLQEIYLYEMSINDLREATKLQEFFNGCQLQEELDSRIANNVNDLDDANASSRLEQEVHEMLNNEEKRKADNQSIIDSIIHENSKSVGFDDTEDYVVLVASNSVKSHHGIVCSDPTIEKFSETLPCGHNYCDKCMTEWFDAQ